MAVHFSISIPVVNVAKAEQGLATGWGSIVTSKDGQPIIDSEGHVILIEELEHAIHKAFTQHGGKGKGGDMHETKDVADIVESFVVSKEKREALGFGEGPEGWVLTMKVKDPELREKLRRGERPEFSIKGTAKLLDVNKRGGRVELQKRDVKILSELELDEFEFVSTVDKGAGGDDKHRPAIVLYKRAIKKQEQSSMEGLEAFREKLSPEEFEALSALFASLQAKSEDKPLDKEDDKEEEPAEKADEAKEEEAEKKEDEGMEKRFRDELAKQAKENAALREQVEKMRNDTEIAQLQKKVSEQMKAIPQIAGNGKLATILKRCGEELLKEDYESLEKALVSASAIIEKSPIFKAVGSDYAEPGTATAEITELAKREIKEGYKGGLQAAIAKVGIDQPELFRRYRQEIGQ